MVAEHRWYQLRFSQEIAHPERGNTENRSEGLVNQSLGHWGSECNGLEMQRTRGSSLGKTPLLEENGAFWKGTVSLGGIIVK